MLKALRSDLEKEEESPGGLLELFFSLTNATLAPEGGRLCPSGEHGKRTGCKLGCSCAWYASCFPKFGATGAAEGFAPERNIGVCEFAVPILIIISVSIQVCLFLVVFAARSCLVDWYCKLEWKDMAEQMERDQEGWEGLSSVGFAPSMGLAFSTASAAPAEYNARVFGEDKIGGGEAKELEEEDEDVTPAPSTPRRAGGGLPGHEAREGPGDEGTAAAQEPKRGGTEEGAG